MHALSGDADRAFDSLERVAAKLPALTAARVRRDPDLDALRRPAFEAAVLRRPSQLQLPSSNGWGQQHAASNACCPRSCYDVVIVGAAARPD